MTHEPYPFAGKWTWASTGNDIPMYPEDLPRAVFTRLAGGELLSGVRYYGTRDAAMRDLNEARQLSRIANGKCPR